MPLCTLIDGIPSINCPSIGLLTLIIKKNCIFNIFNTKAGETEFVILNYIHTEYLRPSAPHLENRAF